MMRRPNRLAIKQQTELGERERASEIALASRWMSPTSFALGLLLARVSCFGCRPLWLWLLLSLSLSLLLLLLAHHCK